MQPHKTTVEQLFQIMAAYYGNNWNKKWAGISRDDILNVWEEKLRDYLAHHPENIQWAIDHLPVHPPGLPEFMLLCKECPQPPPAPALPPPHAPMPEKLRRITRRAHYYLRQADTQRNDNLGWARNIMGKLRDNMGVPYAVQQTARQALMKRGEFFDRKGYPIEKSGCKEDSAHA